MNRNHLLYLPGLNPWQHPNALVFGAQLQQVFANKVQISVPLLIKYFTTYYFGLPSSGFALGSFPSFNSSVCGL